MLQAMRKSVGSIFVKVVLFGLLIFSFAIWGVEDMFRVAVGNDPVAEIGGDEITQEEFDRRYSQEMIRLRQNGLDDATALAIGLPTAILDRMVEEALLRREVGELRLTTTDAAIATAIRQEPAFQNSLGQFDRLRYEQILASQGLNEAGFVAQLRQDLAQRTLLSAITGAVEAPNALVDTLFAFSQERRRFDALPVRIDPASVVDAPDEATLKAYFEENAETYRAPELREVAWVHMTIEEIADEIAIDEAELRATYEANLPSYSTPETRTLIQLQFQSEEAARAAHEALLAGKTPEEATADGGAVIDLGQLRREDVIDGGLGEAAFAAAEPGPLPPLQGMFGWVVPIVESIQPGTTESFEQVRDEIRDGLVQERAADQLFSLSGAVEEAIGTGSSLETAAESFDLPVRRATLDATGRDLDGNPVENVPQGGRFLQVAFDESEGLESLLEEDGQDGFFILRVDAVTPSRLRPYEEVAERVLADWQAEERVTQAVDRAEALAERVRRGSVLSDLALEIGADLILGVPVTRSGNDTGVPLAVLSDAFAMDEGAVRVSETPDGIYVLKLQEILPPDPETAEVRRENLSNQVASGLEDMLLAELQSALRERHAVTTNPALAQTIADPLSRAAEN